MFTLVHCHKKIIKHICRVPRGVGQDMSHLFLWFSEFHVNVEWFMRRLESRARRVNFGQTVHLITEQRG